MNNDDDGLNLLPFVLELLQLPCRLSLAIYMLLSWFFSLAQFAL